MDASAVANLWWRTYGETPPVGFLLRDDNPESWLRLYTLPLGKRIPSSEAERRVVLERFNEVAGVVLEGPGTVGVFVIDSEPPGDGERSPPLIERVGMARVTGCPDSWVRRLNEHLDMSVVAIWAGIVRWAPGCLDPLMIAAALDEVGPVTLFSVERGDALCLYDGGVDLFVREPLKTTLATLFREWLV